MSLASNDVVGNSTAFFIDRHMTDGEPDRVALQYEGAEVTYAELHANVCRFANLFRGLGLELENRVVLALPDMPELCFAIFGALRIGSVPVSVSTRLAYRDFRYICGDARPKGAIVTRQHLEDFRQIRKETGFPQWIYVIEDRSLDPNTGDSLDYADLDAVAELRETSLDDVAVIQYTSGSTGTPKGVVHLHRGLMNAPLAFGQRLQLTPEDSCFSAAKISFGYGFGNSLLFPLAAGARTVLHPGQADPFAVIRIITSVRPTVFFAVPSLYAAILTVARTRNELDLSALRLCISAGERLPAATFDEWRDRFGLELLDGLGATECLHIFISAEPGDAIPGKTGRPVPGVEVKLTDDNGTPLPAGEQGHVWVKSECNAARYWNKHPETTETMVGKWVRTGDILRREDDDYVFIGRADDIIKVGGFKVAPSEIEERLMQHEAVAECAVVEHVTDEGVSTISAHVRLQPDWDPSTERVRELKEFVKSDLAGYKCPETINFIEDFPRTPTGKIARYKLRQEVRQEVR